MTFALVTYIFMELTYGNWQRPAVGVRMTLTEARAHQDSGSDVISLTVGLHKTTSSQGPAVIIMRGAARAAYLHYIDNIRPSLPTKSSDSELALVTSNGRPLVNYTDLIKTLLRHYNLPSLPTLTTARKAGATGFLAREKTQERMEQLSRHMSHQHATNIRYYRLANRRQEAVATHATITEVTASCKL